jgi:hypothetical protein
MIYQGQQAVQDHNHFQNLNLSTAHSFKCYFTELHREKMEFRRDFLCGSLCFLRVTLCNHLIKII